MGIAEMLRKLSLESSVFRFASLFLFHRDSLSDTLFLAKALVICLMHRLDSWVWIGFHRNNHADQACVNVAGISHSSREFFKLCICLKSERKLRTFKKSDVCAVSSPVPIERLLISGDQMLN
jgi:hypothetical protein